MIDVSTLRRLDLRAAAMRALSVSLLSSALVAAASLSPTGASAQEAGFPWPSADAAAAPETPQTPRRRTIRLGGGGALFLGAPRLEGRVVAEDDPIAVLSADHDVAGVAYLPNQALRSLSAPAATLGAGSRVTTLSDAQLDDETGGGALAAERIDPEIARVLRLSFLEGVDRLTDPDARAELRCLTEAIYFEARGEPIAGQAAVAEVVLTRVESRHWPNTVCEVVNQGSERRTGCQFSYTCDGEPEKVTSPAAWDVAHRIAKLLMKGAPRRLTARATHYHADYVDPSWTRTMEKTATIGRHIFYRRLLRFATTDAPETPALPVDPAMPE